MHATKKSGYATVISASFLPYAYALSNSLLQSGNRNILNVLVTDANTSNQHRLPDSTEFMHFISLSELSTPVSPDMLIYFDALELSNTLKPFLISHLLYSAGYTHIAYLDADLFFTSSLDPVWDKNPDASVLVTPHHVTPPSLKLTYINEKDIVDMGYINGGFACWRATETSRKILNWMMERFPVYGFAQREKGMFADQKLLPLLFSYFAPHIQCLSTPTLNIAFWNAHERYVEQSDDGWHIQDERVIFFHMSGYKLTHPEVPCSYLPEKNNRDILEQSPWFQKILKNYFELLEPHFNSTSAIPYGYSHYHGIELSPALRRFYFQHRHLKPEDPKLRQLQWIERLKQIKRKLLPYRAPQ